MAMLASRAAKVPAMERMANLLRNSFFLRRDFSSSASTANTTPLKKSKRKKKKNLFEVAQFLPNWGIGYHMAKAHWSGVSYQVTKINLYKVLYSSYVLCSLFFASSFFYYFYLF